MGFIQWEKYLLSGKAEALAMTQAALIGQTFAMLSGVSLPSIHSVCIHETDFNRNQETFLPFRHFMVQSRR